LQQTALESRLSITRYYNQLKADDVVFFYKGTMSAELFDAILSLAEDKVSGIEQNLKYKRKIYVISVEILQNIFHHSDSLSNQEKQNSTLTSIFFILGKYADGYFIEAGNFVPTEEAERLQERINKVNEMDEAHLKSHYRQVLKNGLFSVRGGAGLGIIDIARKSGQKLEYDFGIQEEKHTLFSLKVKIPVN
jgi:hypothetical protein